MVVAEVSIMPLGEGPIVSKQPLKKVAIQSPKLASLVLEPIY
ncbi:hypothetical protein [Methanothermococcus sp.]|nr:hypothetical protein [Methanothermococcus sp.]